MSYQTFLDQQGDSDSVGKLAALHWPDLQGKSVLDLGCNEGFFCQAALAAGAKRVVGIDTNAHVIERARQRTPQAEFIFLNWNLLNGLPDEVFDVILLLSGLHYANPAEHLLRQIYEHLAEEGIFILEAGVAPGPKKEWVGVKREVGEVFYPSHELLITLLEKFAVKYIGPSVPQQGDPIGRGVFHCRRKKPILLLITGHSGSGKSVFGRECAHIDVPVFALDEFLLEYRDACPDNALRIFLKNYDPEQAADFFIANCRHPMMEILIEAISQNILTHPFSVAEGWAFGMPELRAKFEKALSGRGFYTWWAERGAK